MSKDLPATLAAMKTLTAVLVLAVIAYAIPAHADATDTWWAAKVRQDYATEFKLLQPSADQEGFIAEEELADMYRFGRGVPQSDVEAARCYHKAADLGDPIAQDIIGILYVRGQGVPKDYVQAHMWFNLAASGDSSSGQIREDAIQLRDSLEQLMTPEQIAEAQKQTAAWRPISLAQ